MNKRNLLIILAILITAPFFPSRGQRPAIPAKPVHLEDIQIAPPNLFGEVIRVSGEFRLRIENNDDQRSFQGLATIGFGNAIEQVETVKVKLSLAPQESALHLLYSMPAIGEQYSLVVTDEHGRIVLHKIAPVKSITDPSLAAPPPQALSTVNVKSESGAFLKVRPRLAGGTGENDPYLLAFELSSATPINNAHMRITAKGLNDAKPLSFTGATNVEFKLPDDLEVQKIGYTVIGSKGETLASGEADIVQLMNADDVTIGNVKLDKETFKPGETAKITVEYIGNTTNGIRVEITAKDITGKVVYRDLRKEKREAGLPTHEFTISIPRDTKDAISVEIKIFDAEANTVLDTSSKDIIISNN